MEKFTTHTGVAVPLRRSAIDTDQIIPAVYLKRVNRTGFEDGMFAAWRADEHFVLNLAPYRTGSVLVAGPDFGTVFVDHPAFKLGARHPETGGSNMARLAIRDQHGARASLGHRPCFD